MFRLAASLPRTIHPAAAPAPTLILHRFGTTASSLSKSLPARPKPPPDSEIDESFLKGSGPGGQKIVRAALPIMHTVEGLHTDRIPRAFDG